MWLEHPHRLYSSDNALLDEEDARSAQEKRSQNVHEYDHAMAIGVSILRDLPCSVIGVHSAEISTEMETANVRIPTAKYTKMGETLRYVIPSHMQCSMACGGKACKYENPSRWSDEEQAIKGLYSSWVTDNLLAMARPSSEIIEKYNIIEQFQRCDVKTVINLQRPGEHSSCGNPLEQESGFTYRPETFMEAGIYYYNFGWKDYGVASLTTVLDMVKVMSFAIQEGKIAVHCHAGLGRTGVLLACYLVFTSRMNADQAILFVRAKRPNSIQTRGQLLCVREFAQFLVPLRNVFSCVEPKTGAVTLSQYLTRQRHLLHGYEARQMKNVPKLVQLVCRRLVDIAANRQVVIEEEWLDIPDLTAEVEKTVSQQALQQLGKELRGKGIPVPPCSSNPFSPMQTTPAQDQPLISDNELDPLWRQNAATPLRSSLSNNKNLSYSDSVLYKLEPRQQDLASYKSSTRPVHCLNKHSLSHSSLTASSFHPQDIATSIIETGCPFVKTILSMGDPGLSLALSKQEMKAHCYTTLPVLPTKMVDSRELQEMHVPANDEDNSVLPVPTLHSELSPENRTLQVAKALAMDQTDKDVTAKVTMWQTELNSKEGAWERLCMERDPLVLSSLMWSWLEQLREPVISSENVKSLTENVNPQRALDSLEKGHRLTLLCILDCAAHLLPMPEEVETSILDQTIKTFTKIESSSGENQWLYNTLKEILTCILHDLQNKALQVKENGTS
ncbi:protein tyrosine phosphatase domain-containing protein 1 isoform X1 [Dunckerocampus dactyliophorus]|uniref:protein tyrosine phosphatase domain-containing protein 1 isoform X1 n=1 Tax=Dunckerocampus dactyliophorus TaxID=161453 RepID=UPI0024050C78|nr:protein tyrosine phosphatase domain-containing protein 1 isoform X1 [Dunckerocampus dactyliophorus]